MTHVRTWFPIAALCLAPALAFAQGTAPGPVVKAAKPGDKPVEAKAVDKPVQADGAPKAPEGAAAPASPAPSPAADPAAAAAAAAKANATRILVLPYQAIYRSVPQKKLASASDLLFKELGQKEDVAIVKGAVNTGAEQKGPSLETAKVALAEAEKAEGEKRIDDAIGHWQKGILAMEANAAAVADASEYIAAHHRLARAFMWSGRDKEAQDTLAIVARMAPAFELPKQDFSRLYRRWHTDATTAFAKERPGQITVSSALPGAKVSIDGRAMPETAPLLLDKVVPGKHLVLVEVPEVTPFGAVVTVTAGGNAQLRATFGNTLGGSSVGQVTDAIAENAIPTPAVDGAAAAGKAADAKFVIFGAMAKDEDKFRVHTFAVEVSSGKIAKLDEVAFDLDLLTAEADVLKIANAVHGAIAAFPAGERAIAKVEPRIRSQSTVTKVDASPEMVASRVGEGPKKDKGPRQVLKALKGGTVKIKDEED